MMLSRGSGLFTNGVGPVRQIFLMAKLTKAGLGVRWAAVRFGRLRAFLRRF
jgi:hypothetical protein